MFGDLIRHVEFLEAFDLRWKRWLGGSDALPGRHPAHRRAPHAGCANQLEGDSGIDQSGGYDKGLVRAFSSSGRITGRAHHEQRRQGGNE